MIISVPARASANPRRIASFDCYSYIIIQVIGPGTLYIAESADELKLSSDAGTQDGIQINQASGLIALWWKGELWAAGSITPTMTFLLQAPGALNTTAAQGNPTGGGLPQ